MISRKVFHVSKRYLRHVTRKGKRSSLKSRVRSSTSQNHATSVNSQSKDSVRHVRTRFRSEHASVFKSVIRLKLGKSSRKVRSIERIARRPWCVRCTELSSQEVQKVYRMQGVRNRRQTRRGHGSPNASSRQSHRVWRYTAPSWFTRRHQRVQRSM